MAEPEPIKEDLSTALAPLPRPELVIGLVGPMGVDLDPVVDALTEGLVGAGYRTKPIRLSKVIEEAFGVNFSEKPENERIDRLMRAGTILREKSRRGDAVAWLAISEIARIRKEELGASQDSNAYILRSLKHPSEVERLRAVYGRGFVLISVYAPRDVRVTALADRITKSRFGKKLTARAKAEKLVEKDETEEGRPLGQDVKDAFPLADFFVDGRSIDILRHEVERFLHLFFGNVFHTPSRDEHGMYHARSAALRSADLNRQVGAAIIRDDGDIVSVGCNDVPKTGGDLYWEGDAHDARDFKRGLDSSAQQRTLMLAELFGRLKEAKLLVEEERTKNIESLVSGITHGDLDSILKGSGVMNLLEFGRSVHAEMAALMAAARLGVSVRGSTLYSTTFPCHMCARHIVASGIRRVVYVEPYPKSRAKQLHSDSISIDPLSPSVEQVNFVPFEGVAPRQYLHLFDAGELRKQSDGRASVWKLSEAKVRFQRYVNSYIDIEVEIESKYIGPLLAIAQKYKDCLSDSSPEEES